MTDKTPQPEQDEPGNDIVAIVEHNPAIVLLNEKKRDALFAHIEKDIEAFTPDLTTAKGREEIKSFAYKITRTKTAIDKAAKGLTEEWRNKTNAVNAERKDIVEALDAKAKGVRRPLDEWEEKEANRVNDCATTIQRLTAWGVVSIDATADEVGRLIQEITETAIEPDYFQGMAEAAEKAKAHSLELLGAALARIRQQEEQAAELERLRAAEAQRRAEEERRQKEERDAREAEERRQREEEERAAEQARVAEAQRKAAEDAKEREERAAAAAAEAAQREAEDKARHEREAQERAHAEALAAERRRAEEAAAALEAERQKAAREQAEREATERAEREERERREADIQRRTAAKTEAKEAIMQCGGVKEAIAIKIVLAIINREIPRVFLDFAADPAPHKPSRELFDEERAEAGIEK